MSVDLREVDFILMAHRYFDQIFFFFFENVFSIFLLFFCFFFFYYSMNFITVIAVQQSSQPHLVAFPSPTPIFWLDFILGVSSYGYSGSTKGEL